MVSLVETRRRIRLKVKPHLPWGLFSRFPHSLLDAELGDGIGHINMHAIEQTYISLLADIGSSVGVPSIGRSAYEGLSWCINDAPQLEKEVLANIESGSEFSSNWPTWLIPLRDRFLRTNSPQDLKALRQLLLFCYKAEHRHTNETTKIFETNWVRTQAEVSLVDPEHHCSASTSQILARARTHCTATLGLLDWSSIIPYHGPGAVFDRNMNKGKWSKWFSAIDKVYPYYKYFYLSNPEHWASQPLAEDKIDDCIIARLTSVPKDARGPRLICVHPTEAIWIQEGLRDKLERSIQRKNIPPWNWPCNQIHFDDQTHNGTLALQASIDRRFATLDLKEASDRLSDCLVRYLFGSNYKWFESCRAEYVSIPSLNMKVPVSCYAPMGNATTFPVQSLVFWSVCVATMEVFHQLDHLLVFGDDIIVPSSLAPRVIEVLEELGLVVNRSKSFYKGAFRESCGVEAFNGFNVTPIRWKTTYDPSSYAGLQAMSSIAQKLRMDGYLQSSIELYSLISAELRKVGKQLPVTNNPEHGGISEYTENLTSVWANAKWHKPYQKFVTPVYRLRETESSFPHGWNHVLTSLSSLQRTGRSDDPARAPSRGLRLNRGWTDVL